MIFLSYLCFLSQKVHIFDNWVVCIYGAKWFFLYLIRMTSQCCHNGVMTKEITVHSWYIELTMVQENCSRYRKFETTNGFQPKYDVQRLGD